MARLETTAVGRFMEEMLRKLRTSYYVMWIDNFARFYFALKMRCDIGTFRPAMYTVASVTFPVDHEPPVPITNGANGAPLPCLPSAAEFFAPARAIAVEYAVHGSCRGFVDGWWMAYYDRVSITVKEKAVNIPVKPKHEERLDRADPGRRRGLHCPYDVRPQNCGSTIGLCNVLDWVCETMEDHAWSLLMYSFLKADVDLFMKLLKMHFSTYSLFPRLFRFTIIIMAPWHVDKILTKRVYEAHFHTIIAPLLRTLCPGLPLVRFASHQVRVATLASISAAYAIPANRRRFKALYNVYNGEVRASRRNNGNAPPPPPLPQDDIVRHLWMFFEFFLPLVSTFLLYAFHYIRARHTRGTLCQYQCAQIYTHL
jgi:hypothetical protein